jgi:hypothetical protein
MARANRRRVSAPITQVVRASKAHLVALDQNSTIIAVIAVSRARSWSREGEPAGVV